MASIIHHFSSSSSYSPSFFPPSLPLFSSSSSYSPSLSLFKFNQKLSFSSSSAPFLPTPQIAPIIQQTHLQLSPSNPTSFSSQHTHILHNKCLDLLRLSVRYSDIELARAVHPLILKLEEDNYLCNSLITAYINLGLLSDAYNVFAGISNPDVVSFTTIISGFAKYGYAKNGIKLFWRLRERGIYPNGFTFVAMLNACSRILELGLGFQIHGLLVKLGYVYSTYVANALMRLYIKCQCLDDALQVFDEMPERDIASWNTVLSGVSSVFLYNKTFELFHEMQIIDGLTVDHFTLSSLVSACVGCSSRLLGREIHGHALKAGFENNLSVNNALIGFYTRCGRAKDVQALFERMPSKDVISWTGMITAYMEFGMVDLAMEVLKKMPERNPVSFNAVLAGLCQNGRALDALSMFIRMVTHGAELTESSLTSAISACALQGKKDISEQIHGFAVKFGFGSNACIEAALLDMCTRCERMTDAQLMFHQSGNEQNLSINWTSMICGYARNAKPEEAINVFQWGHADEGMIIDEVVATTILGVCGTIGFYELGEQMHCQALKLGFLRDSGVGNAIVSMYSKCAYIEEAIKVFDSLPKKDVVSWNCLISGHLLQRQGNDALAVWSRMRAASIMPDSITLVLVISSYKHTKLNMVDDCRVLFFSMKKLFDVEPTSDHYASFVGVLGYWGYLEEAEEIIATLPFDPNTSVWRALLNSCRIHADSTIGKRIAKRILAMQPQDPSTYILISNLFSASGRWHCSEMIREEMRMKGLRKHPTRSWIVYQNKVHYFYVRDRSHSQSKDIYSGLEILILECLKAGYVPDTSFVLHEVEEQQKKDFLYYHSAKLAVTYGLLVSKTGKPVRVTKNVVLCGDCHNFLKYVSKVTRREICVRDSTGFHYFSDGKCSCKDQW